MKMMSITMLLYLNGARFTIPAKPRIRSAKNRTSTITEIVKAVIQSPFGTAATPGGDWMGFKVRKSLSYLQSSSHNRGEITFECDLFWQFPDCSQLTSIIGYVWVSRRGSRSKASNHTNFYAGLAGE